MLPDEFSQEQPAYNESQASTKGSESYHKTQSQKIALSLAEESPKDNRTCKNKKGGRNG